MNVISFGDRACERVRRYLDSYMNDELLVETNHEVLRHLEVCAECRAVLDSRLKVKNLLQNAVGNTEVPADLSESIQRRLRSTGIRRTWTSWALAAAATVLLVLGGRELLDSAQVRKILRIGLIDHVHCAIQVGTGKLTQSLAAITGAEGRGALGPDFSDLARRIQDKVGDDLPVVVGHRCTANGRQYIHLILRNSTTMMSVVVTKKGDLSYPTGHLQSVMRAAGIPVRHDRIDEFEVAGIETARYLAFVVSDLRADSNVQMASALAPTIDEVLSRTP